MDHTRDKLPTHQGTMTVFGTFDPPRMRTKLGLLKTMITDACASPTIDFEHLSMHAVILDEPIPFGKKIADDLLWLRLLRDVTSHGIRLDWTLAGRPKVPLHTYVHLLPPTAGTNSEASLAATEWAAGFRYGLYYYRLGPDFVSVKDVRPGVEGRRLTIADGFDHFLAIARALSSDELSDDAMDALRDAIDADLALEVDGRVLLLPYRMRHWPVPYTGA